MKHKGKFKKTVNKKEEKKSEFVSWYEIPAANLERAIQFYSFVFDVNFEATSTATHTMALFPAETGIGGALVYGDGSIPSQTGPLLYLNAGDNLDHSLIKVIEGGGQVLMGKTLISEEVGHYSLVLDSEGNRLALYSKS